MRGIGTGRPSAGGRIATAALCALLALGGATAALADEAIVVGQDAIEATGGAAAGQEEAGSVAAQADRLGPQADGTVTAGDTKWSDGNTYTVARSVTIIGRITCTGNVTLVLSENTKLTAEKGITVAEGNTLTIKGSGELVAGGGATPIYYAGIGGAGGSGGTISIEGGTVTATGGTSAAGIGGAKGGKGGTVTIGGGTVTATGGTSAAGIGGANGGKGGTVTIGGGTVTATGGTSAAGIGGGSLGGSGGTVTISGGTVTATGGFRSAGIGGGYGGSGGTAVIKGGTVTATGGDYGPGIGGGGYGPGGTVTIEGGTVMATGGLAAAGIGGGLYDIRAGTVTITGGTVTATGGDNPSKAESDSGSDMCCGGTGIGTGGSYYAGGEGQSSYGTDGGTVTIGGDAVVRAIGGTDKRGDNGVSDGIGVCGAAKKAGAGSATLEIGSGRFLYGSESDISTDVNESASFRSGAVASYAGDRYQYMVVNGNKVAVSLSYATTSVAKAYGDAAFTNPLANPSDVAVTYESSDTSVATVDSAGKVTVKAAGTTTIKATYAGDDAHEPTSASYELTVNKAAPKLTYATTSVTKTYGDAAFTNPLTNPSEVAVAYASSDAGVATVDGNGKVTLAGAGTATITAGYAGDANHEPASASYELTVEPAENPAVTLKFRKAKVTKAYGAKAFTNKLTNESGVIVTYKSSNKKVAKVNKTTGKVTLKGPGTATITATFAGDANYEAATASYKVVVKLAKTRGLKTVCHPGKHTIDVSWGKVKGAKKYLVQWRLRGGKWRTRATEGTELTLCGMRARRYYEIRVRAVSGKRRGSWSTVSRRWYVPAAGVRAKAATKGKVAVSWSKTKRANKGYLVLVRYSKDGPIVAKKTVGKGQTSATISGLKPGKRAWVSVRPLRRAYGKTWIGVLTPIAGVKIG